MKYLDIAGLSYFWQKIKTALAGKSDVGHTHSNYVPTTRTVNSKALSSNITLSASDVGAVPTTRKVNGKELSADITITGADVGAFPIPAQLSTDSKTYAATSDAPTYNYTMPFSLTKGDCIAYKITIKATGGGTSYSCKVNIKRPSGGTYLDTTLYEVVSGGTTKGTLSFGNGGTQSVLGYLYRVS